MRFPTLPEVFSSAFCLFVGHEWTKYRDANDQLVTACANCGARP